MSVVRQVTIHVAQNPDQKRKIIRGKIFERYEQYNSLDDAVRVATRLRVKGEGVHPDNWTISEVVDCGPRAGYGRYAVFIRRGRAF